MLWNYFFDTPGSLKRSAIFKFTKFTSFGIFEDYYHIVVLGDVSTATKLDCPSESVTVTTAPPFIDIAQGKHVGSPAPEMQKQCALTSGQPDESAHCDLPQSQLGEHDVSQTASAAVVQLLHVHCTPQSNQQSLFIPKQVCHLFP
jgi:hypothetical protein